ncbi:long-chain-fatty-acid--CoA ligase [Caballeronia novacaledonica]|uniref:Long-chain-fatty-acid--CoA ligase n=1 Tax=Caballeronia novacaledonica TaxID=1544861 RepID=A0A2U3I9H6_9BURK|nr:AMP-binding protein [Caballeronia novacaledonica]SPB16761.1 long-chain-fatty-acid--CoA ligase [Caballeronia novacaledonica]
MSALPDRIAAPARSPLDASTLRAVIDARAQSAPDKPFLLSTTQEDALTFAALRDDCIALEARFRAAGLRPGDVVSVFMGNGIQTARLLLATMYSGLVANPLNLLCQASQVRYIVEHSDTRVIFVTDDTRDTIVEAIDALRREGMDREIAVVCTSPGSSDMPDIPTLSPHAIPLVRDETPGTHIVASDAGAPNPGDTALLMYTSGTTGAPKGVLLSHRSLLANMRNISAEHRLSDDDRVLVSLPLYHINGLVVALLTPLWHGGSAVMTPRFSARTFWREASHSGCTWINVVPTIVAYLLNAEDAQDCDLSALKFCRSASAALPADHHRAFEERFGIGVIETMGMTETAAPMFSNPYERTMRRLGSIGLPSGGEAKIVDLDGRECGPNESGELVLRGAQMMSGYYKRPEETRDAFTADGWLRTGDLGYRDEAGFFYINGRAKELIIKGGENIAPREIDEALLRHPGVLEAAAVGVPDAAYGQDIVAYIVPNGGAASLDVAELRAHCLRELGRYKTPREFRFTDALPRGPSGKVQRLKLVQNPQFAAG